MSDDSLSPVLLAEKVRQPWWMSTWPDDDGHEHAARIRAAKDLARIVAVFDRRKKIASISQRRLATSTGLSINTIKAIWRGETFPDYRTLHRVGEVLGVRLEAVPDPDPPIIKKRLPPGPADVASLVSNVETPTQRAIIELLRTVQKQPPRRDTHRGG